MNKENKNLYLFFGEDDFSLREKINLWKQEFAKKYSGTSIVELSGATMPEDALLKMLEEILTPSLFSSKKLIIARNIFPTKSSQEKLISALEKTVASLPSDYFLVFWQDTLDRRLTFIKNILKQVNVVEFHLPHGRELNAWIKKRAQSYGTNLDDSAVEKLAVLVGRDLYEEKKAGGKVISRTEMFDLWQVNSELLKLAAYSNQINSQKVGELVYARVPENVFALSDAVVAQNKKAALEVLANLMAEQNADEKSTAIKLVGLLSEQLRSLAVVNLLKNQNMDQNQIAQFLGWSPGRVFVTLKHSANLNLEKLRHLLEKLMRIDTAVKSSDVNPELLLDLLIVQ